MNMFPNTTIILGVGLQERLMKPRWSCPKRRPGSIEAKDAEGAIARYERRLALGDYFNFLKIEDLPSDLLWKDGLDEPEDSDPAAKKGGVFRLLYRKSAAHHATFRA
jgi:hypothetical protein